MKWKIAFMVGMLSDLAFSQNVIINELMYAPSGGRPEWVELYNKGPDSTNLKNWTISNKSGVKYKLTSADLYVSSHSYLVLTSSNDFTSFHPEPGINLIKVSWPQYFLVNTGDTVTLRDASGLIADSVWYLPSWGGGSGKSLERISASDSSRSIGNWGTSVDPSGSTPGRINSIAAKEHDLRAVSLKATYFSADAKTVFEVLVKNSGSQSVPIFSVDVFVDYNTDSLAQPDELAATAGGAGLAPGDSMSFLLEKSPMSAVRANAIAVINYDSDEDTTNNAMTTRINSSYPQGSVVVNEIMYAPINQQPEWVELFNASQDSIMLGRFTLSDNSGTKATLPESARLLVPSGYAVIADDSSFFQFHPGISDRVIVVAIPSLNNTGDAVVVRDASGRTMDSVAYSPSWGGNSGGRSLERILPAGGSNDPHNFETCADTSKSTPGRINSVTRRDRDLAVGNIGTTPAHLQSGQRATITASIINVGIQASGNATAILFKDVDGDGYCDPGEAIDSLATAPLPPGDSMAVSFSTGALDFGTCRFGVFVNYPDDERESDNVKTILLNVGLPPATIVINELMYAPKQPEQEWVELLNAADAAVDLSNFRIATHGGSVKIKTGSVIAPNGFIVLCKDSSISQLHYPVANLVIQTIPSLNNGGDAVALYDNLGNLLDTMNYLPSYGGSSGRSLERVDYLQGNDPTNWDESVDSTGATPGASNSVAILPYDAALRRIDLSAAPKAPGETGEISIVLANRGRNAAENASASVNIVRAPDSVSVHSETRRLDRALATGDSEAVTFQWTPEKPGTYTVEARAALENDPRSWNDTMSTQMNIAYPARSAILNEIMFTNGPSGEYFEIFNASSDRIDLAGWEFHTSSSNMKPIGNLSRRHILEPGGYFVVSSDSSILEVVPDTGRVHISRSMSLRDDGDCIVISDPGGIVVDSVYYLPSWHNADIARTYGRSLEKINPSLPTNEKTSWSTCVSQYGGTPGGRNSLFVDAGQTAGAISVAPNPFSPDADGRDDFTFISYSFPVTSVKIRIRIFDSVGRLIATPTDNAVLPSAGKLVWDGRDSSGKIVRFGLYILFMEVTGPDGKSLSTYKTPIVVAKRMR